MKRFSIPWILLLLVLVFKVSSEVRRDRDRDEWLLLPREIFHRLCGHQVVYLVPYPAAPRGDALLRAGEDKVDTVDCTAWPKLVEELKSRGVILHCSRLRRIPLDASAIVVQGVPTNKRSLENVLQFPKEHALLSVWEPPVVEPAAYREDYHDHFARVLTWNDDLVASEKYRKFHIVYPLQSMRPVPPFHERRLLTLISGNKSSSHPFQLYSERRKVIDFFESQPGNDFTFYGVHWEPLGLRNYGGTPKSKFDVLSNFRFSICYENCHSIPGYVTEKILDCFVAGSVPVYWGAPNIEDYVPRDCFIAREDFADEAELYAYLQAMSEEEYNGYLDRIRSYLASDRPEVFSHDGFVKTFADEIMAVVAGQEAPG